MEMISKLEQMVSGWFKKAPHLPIVAKKWLGENVWWLTALSVVLLGIVTIVGLFGLFSLMSIVGTVASYYAVSTYTGLAVVSGFVALVFSVISIIVMGMAVTPLKEKQKKGWTLLFVGLLVNAVYLVVSAVLTMSVLGFITSIILGGIGLTIGAWLLVEIKDQFAIAMKSKGVKNAK